MSGVGVIVTVHDAPNPRRSDAAPPATAISSRPKPVTASLKTMVISNGPLTGAAAALAIATVSGAAVRA